MSVAFLFTFKIFSEMGTWSVIWISSKEIHIAVRNPISVSGTHNHKIFHKCTGWRPVVAVFYKNLFS